MQPLHIHWHFGSKLLALPRPHTHHSADLLRAGNVLTCNVWGCAMQSLAQRLSFLQNAVGSALAPFDCWLLMRGLKTMAVSDDDTSTSLSTA